MERIDIAIIGCGPAGVSAALTARARNKDVRLFRNGRMSSKVSKAQVVRNYPGLPDIAGADFAAALERHLEVMEVDVVETQVAGVYDMGDRFAIQAADGFHDARSVILATGMMQGSLLPGEADLVGRGLSYCATCDGSLYRGKTVAAIGYSSDSDAEVGFLAEFAEQVIYFPLMDGTRIASGGNIRVVAEKPLAVAGDLHAEGVTTAEGLYRADGVFIMRDSVLPDRLVPGLELEEGHVKVDAWMRTNLPGCFACGDVAGKPYQYVKAAGQGNVAALSAVRYLSERPGSEALS